LKNQKFLIPMIIFVLIILVVGVGFYYGKIPFAVFGEMCQNIYSYDSRFLCCVEKQGNTLATNLYSGSTWDNPIIWQCPSTASKCSIHISEKVLTGKVGCSQQFSLLIGKFFKCNDEKLISSSQDIEPSTYVYAGGGYIPSKTNTNVQFTYEVFDLKLYECGYAGCTVGAEVGASGCSFVADKTIYDTNGNLIANVGSKIDVPKDTCYTYVDSSSRRLIGDTCEICSGTSDCKNRYPLRYSWGGVEYGAVCSGRNLQLYDCVQDLYSQVCVNEVYIGNEKRCEEYAYKTKCDIFKSISVECCSPDSCGTGATCNMNTFTCEIAPQCSKDSDCGVNIVCDYNNLELKEKKCVNSKCEFVKIRSVGCCGDANCPNQYYCSGYQCYEKIPEKQTCPYECCISETNYIDRYCTSGNVCCADHTCKINCNDIEPENRCNFNGLCESEIGETKNNCIDCYDVVDPCDFKCGELNIICQIRESWCRLMQKLTLILYGVAIGFIFFIVLLLCLRGNG